MAGSNSGRQGAPWALDADRARDVMRGELEVNVRKQNGNFTNMGLRYIMHAIDT